MNPLYPVVAQRAGHRCEHCRAPEAPIREHRHDPTAAGNHVCPNGHKVPEGQRYCIVCDTYF